MRLFTLIQINDTDSVLFIEHHIKGMVGEHIGFTTAKLLTINEGDPLSSRDIKYPKLKSIYKHIMGKDRRIQFHRLMKQMSPEDIKEQEEIARQDAISRVI